MLHSLGDELTAARVSFCWRDDRQGLCVDTFPPVTKRSLPVRPGRRIRVAMGTDTDSLSATLRRGHGRRLRVRRIDERHFRVLVPRGMKRPRVLDLFARYPEGDGAFGARLRVP